MSDRPDVFRPAPGQKDFGLSPTEVDLRHARWLIERAAPHVGYLPSATEALETARQVLGQLAGDYREGEADRFEKSGSAFESGDSIQVHVPDATRADLVRILATMPDEAYGWFVVWCLRGYPDGLGGFMPDSRASITALRAAANAYIPPGP